MALVFPYHSFLTVEEFQEQSGYNLIDRLGEDDPGSEDGKARRFLLEITGQLYKLVSKFSNTQTANYVFNSGGFDEILKLAQYYQALYVFENGGSLASLNGLSSDNTFLPVNELRGIRDYDESALNVLFDNGLLYCGM